MPLLSIEKLEVVVQDPSRGEKGTIVRGLDLTLAEGECLALVGESGCGKSMTALSILHLLPQPPMEIQSGKILFKGKNLLEMGEAEWRRIRGGEIGIVFQDPLTSLNPVLRVGEQIEEVLRLHEGLAGADARARVEGLLRDVGLSDAERIAAQYPHQLSGGMCQRVMLAVALAGNPSLLIADEPTTALDVTVQAQILDLLFQMKEKHRLSVLFITHDLRIVRSHADRVAILYAGEVVEEGVPEQIFESPRHPYTGGLLKALPGLDRQKGPLFSIGGNVRSPFAVEGGCAFADRCPRAQEKCRGEKPELVEKNKGQWVRCYFPLEN